MSTKISKYRRTRNIKTSTTSGCEKCNEIIIVLAEQQRDNYLFLCRYNTDGDMPWRTHATCLNFFKLKYDRHKQENLHMKYFTRHVCMNGNEQQREKKKTLQK